MEKTVLNDLYMLDDKLENIIDNDDWKHCSKEYQNKILNIQADTINLIHSLNSAGYTI